MFSDSAKPVMNKIKQARVVGKDYKASTHHNVGAELLNLNHKKIMSRKYKTLLANARFGHT